MNVDKQLFEYTMDEYNRSQKLIVTIDEIIELYTNLIGLSLIDKNEMYNYMRHWDDIYGYSSDTLNIKPTIFKNLLITKNSDKLTEFFNPKFDKDTVKDIQSFIRFVYRYRMNGLTRDSMKLIDFIMQKANGGFRYLPKTPDDLFKVLTPRNAYIYYIGKNLLHPTTNYDKYVHKLDPIVDDITLISSHIENTVDKSHINYQLIFNKIYHNSIYLRNSTRKHIVLYKNEMDKYIHEFKILYYMVLIGDDEFNKYNIINRYIQEIQPRPNNLDNFNLDDIDRVCLKCNKLVNSDIFNSDVLVNILGINYIKDLI